MLIELICPGRHNDEEDLQGTEDLERGFLRPERDSRTSPKARKYVRNPKPSSTSRNVHSSQQRNASHKKSSPSQKVGHTTSVETDTSSPASSRRAKITSVDDTGNIPNLEPQRASEGTRKQEPPAQAPLESSQAVPNRTVIPSREDGRVQSSVTTIHSKPSGGKGATRQIRANTRKNTALIPPSATTNKLEGRLPDPTQRKQDDATIQAPLSPPPTERPQPTNTKGSPTATSKDKLYSEAAKRLFQDKADVHSEKDVVEVCKGLNGRIDTLVIDILDAWESSEFGTDHEMIQEDIVAREMVERALGDELSTMLVGATTKDGTPDAHNKNFDGHLQDAIQALTAYCICGALNTIVFGFKKRGVDDSEDTFRRMVEAGEYMVLCK